MQFLHNYITVTTIQSPRTTVPETIMCIPVMEKIKAWPF